MLGAYLAGFDIVRDCMHDATVLGYMNKMLLDEVVPILPLDQEGIKIVAAGSNDSGVSWIVEVAGKRIFHAGDLTNW